MQIKKVRGSTALSIHVCFIVSKHMLAHTLRVYT
jgi:hypothetical protein